MTEKTMLERVQSVRNNEQTQLLNCLVQQNEELLEDFRSLNAKKATQLANDTLFREMWEQLQRNDRHVAYIMVIVAVLAFSLEIVQFEDFYIIQRRLSALIQPITNLFGG